MGKGRQKGPCYNELHRRYCVCIVPSILWMPQQLNLSVSFKDDEEHHSHSCLSKKQPMDE